LVHLLIKVLSVNRQMSSVRHKTSKRHLPICVGIITIPHLKKTKYGDTHIMKQYVDWFEERGVRVIPIPYDTTQHEKYFHMVNGLLIPGGETTFIMKNKTFVDSVTKFFELSLKQDEYFPIWGTCFGFELLMFLIGNFSKLKYYPARGFYPLHITPAGYVSRMFRSFSPRYLHYLEHNKSCNNNHEYGISTSDFMKNEHLRRFYNVLATSVADNDKEYVAAIEAKYYPIYGVQWHPERQKTTGHFVDFFIGELKKNKHKCIPYPYLGTVMKHHKCIQYPEHKNLQCYFF
jgi:gamma-glutamyl hydrolase